MVIQDKMSNKKLSPYKISKTFDGYSECNVIPSNTKHYVESKEERDQRMKHKHANSTHNKYTGTDDGIVDSTVEPALKQKRRGRR